MAEQHTKCPSCGTANFGNARFCSGCGASLSGEDSSPYQAPTSQPGSGGALVSEYIYAGFWKRAIALFLDAIVYSIIWWVFAILFSLNLDWNALAKADEASLGGAILMTYALFYVGWWLYKALQESSSKQATLGKRAMGIKVCDEMGFGISFWRATGRHFAEYITGMTFLIGYIMAAFTSKKQALHDLIASTLVINSNFDAKQVQIAAGSPRKTMSAGAIIGIIALILVVPVGGIIAAIAIPAYQDYTQRARVSAAIEETRFVQQQIVDYAIGQGDWPDNLAKAGVSQRHINNEDYHLQLGSEGRYQIRFNAPAGLKDREVIFTPHLTKGGIYRWECTSSSLPQKYLPANCHGNDD